MLGLIQVAASQTPFWPQDLEAWSRTFQAIVTPVLITIGGAFAWFKFFRQGEHDPRLQPTVTGTATVHDRTIYIVATVTAENTGQVDVALDLEASALNVLTTNAGDVEWTHRYIADVFPNHSVVQPAETIEDQVWLEIPYDGEIGVKLNLAAALSENRVYPTTEIICLI